MTLDWALQDWSPGNWSRGVGGIETRRVPDSSKRASISSCSHGIGNGCVLEASMSRRGSGCRNWLEGELRVFSAQSVSQSIVNHH